MGNRHEEDHKKLAVRSSLLGATLFWVTPFQFDCYPLGLPPSLLTKREPASATDVRLFRILRVTSETDEAARRNSGALRGFGADWSGSGSRETGYLPMTASGDAHLHSALTSSEAERRTVRN